MHLPSDELVVACVPGNNCKELDIRVARNDMKLRPCRLIVIRIMRSVMCSQQQYQTAGQDYSQQQPPQQHCWNGQQWVPATPDQQQQQQYNVSNTSLSFYVVFASMFVSLYVLPSARTHTRTHTRMHATHPQHAHTQTRACHMHTHTSVIHARTRTHLRRMHTRFFFLEVQGL